VAILKIIGAWFVCLIPVSAQVAHDLYASPSAIGTVTSGFVLEGSYAGATVENGERVLFTKNGRPDNEVRQTVWFTFSVPTDGIWKVRVGYPSDWSPFYPSYPVVFEEASLAQAVPMFPTQDNPYEAKCMLQAGRTYRLGLRCYSVENSMYQVAFTAIPSPSNDDIASAVVATGEAFTIDATGATTEAGEISGAEDPVIGSAWVRWKAPSSGKWLLKEIESRAGIIPWPWFHPALFPEPVDTVGEQFAWSPIESSNYRKRGFSLFNSATVVEPMTEVEKGGNWVLFEAEAGQDYWIAGYERWNGNHAIRLELAPAATNDLQENAEDVGDASALDYRGQLLGATVSLGENVPTLSPVSRTVWLKWTARADGPVDVKAEATRVAVQVFLGNDLIGAALPNSWSRDWQFDAVAGLTYHFQVSMIEETNPAFQLRLRATEAADHFSGAIALEGRALLSNVGSSLEPGEPEARSDEGSVWLKWQSDVRQVVSINHQALQAVGHWHTSQGRMEVFKGTSLEDLLPACSPLSENVALFVAEAGETYYIRALAKEEFDGLSQVTLVSQQTGSGLEELLMEAGALFATTGPEREAEAQAVLTQAKAISADDPRILLASAFLELRAAAKTPAGRIMASRILPNQLTLPLGFLSSQEAGVDGVIPTDMTMDDFWESFDAETWPHLDAAIQELTAIAEPVSTYHHPTLPVYPYGKSGFVGTVTDAHDRRTIVAMIMALRGGADYLSSLDGDLYATDFFGWLCDGSPSLETLLDQYPGFLTFGENDRRSSAGLWFAAATLQQDNAKALYQTPSIFFGSDMSLFTDNSQWRLDRWFGWLRSSSGPSMLGITGKSVNLSSWLFGTKSPRDLLPQITGNELRAHTLDDVTFGGLMPDVTEKELHDAWAERGWLADHEELETWLVRFFPENTPDAREDPDGDGISLLHEFAFGLSPIERDSAPYQPEFLRTQMPDSTWRSEITFRRRIGQTRSTYWASRSTDLEHWEIIPLPEFAEPDALPGFEKVRAMFPDGPETSDRAFFKIRFLPPSSSTGVGAISETR